MAQKFYGEDELFLLDSMLYKLKQRAVGIWKELLKAHEQMGSSHSRADPCLCYSWSHNCLMVWLSWIEDNLLLRNKKGVQLHHKKIPKKSIAWEKVTWKICSMQDDLHLSRKVIEDDSTGIYT